MARFGLIGNPVEGSQSPKLFEEAYGGQLGYDLIEAATWDEAWERFVDSSYLAVNVTAPYKEQAFRAADIVSGPCERIGAANILVKVKAEAACGVDSADVAEYGAGAELAGEAGAVGGSEGCAGTRGGGAQADYAGSRSYEVAEGQRVAEAQGFRVAAYNSDFTAVIMCVANAYFPGLIHECYRRYGNDAIIKVHQYVRQAIGSLFEEEPQALVVGCGGGGRAAAVAAAELGFSTTLMNRTQERAQLLVSELPEYHFIADPISDFRGALKECDLIIYTLPVALPEIALLSTSDFEGEEHASAMRPAKVIIEANYKTPAFSGNVLRRLQDAGAQYIPGTQWLRGQAITGYSLMTGLSPAGLL